MSAHPGEQHDPTDDRDRRHPLVEAQAGDLVRPVDSQTLHPESADAVADHVHHEQLAGCWPESSIDPQQQHAEAEAPQRFVQERRVERGARRHTTPCVEVLFVDLERPRQIGRPAVQLLVEVVAPSSDRLREWDGGRRASGGDREGDPAAVRHVQSDRNTEQQPAGDPESALPDLRDAAEVVGEEIPVGGDVVEPGPDHAGEHRPDGDRARVVAGADPPLLEAATEQPDGRDHAQGNHQPVQVEAERTDVDRVEGRARDESDHRRHPLSLRSRV